MPYCPNPECPYRKSLRESAEFVAGTKICSDCGTPLSENDVLGPADKTDRWSKFLVFGDFHKRLLWTLALLVLWNFVRHFPLPGTNSEALELLEGIGGPRISLFALGLMPYITAYILVEIVARLVPRLRHLRTDGPGRARLRRAALILTLVIGIVQGQAIIWQLGTMAGVFVDNGTAFKWLLVLTLVAATFFIIWLADQISAKGCGHGISLIFLSGMLGSIPHDFEHTLLQYKGALSSPQLVMPLLTLAGAIFLIVFMERSARHIPIRYTDGTETSFPLKLTTAGTQPVPWAYGALALSFFFIPVNESFDQVTRPMSTWIVTNLHQGTVVYTAASAVLIIILYFPITALFFNPRDMIAYLEERNASLIPGGNDGKRYIYRVLEGMALVGSLYLVLLPLSIQVIWQLLQTEVTPVNGFELIVAVCITLDLTGELLFRWRSNGLVRVAEFHEPWKAGLLRSLLEKENVPCVIRGYYHRSLLYLFGPYIEMPVFVERSNVNAAREVMRIYLNREGNRDSLES